ncbi:hypothetical protein ACFQ0B_34725 [Nonomuraea thailandensis]
MPRIGQAPGRRAEGLAGRRTGGSSDRRDQLACRAGAESGGGVTGLVGRLVRRRRDRAGRAGRGRRAA